MPSCFVRRVVDNVTEHVHSCELDPSQEEEQDDWQDEGELDGVGSLSIRNLDSTSKRNAATVFTELCRHFHSITLK